MEGQSASYDYLVRHALKQLENGAKILDIGAGNCWMSYRLALAGHKPIAVDLLINKRDGWQPESTTIATA